MDSEIREATPVDVEAIRTVHHDAITELGMQAYTRTQVEAWAQGCESADYASTIESDETVFLVAEREGDVVAFGSLRLAAPEGYADDADAEVTGVYVRPSVAREGVGSRICAALEERARSQDVRTIGLAASRNAVPFYERQGYERIEEFQHEFSSHESTGVTGTIVAMTKTL